ncbi:response regulator [Maridesulfovibrio sp.]|uniref:response regulator n=1 Tax=Maridesulfovibrio sp. TaxID=2795000 RepID=UPI0029F5184F|nr:response regulator [Maridesulfovibrio sp.]
MSSNINLIFLQCVVGILSLLGAVVFSLENPGMILLLCGISLFLLGSGALRLWLYLKKGPHDSEPSSCNGDSHKGEELDGFGADPAMMQILCHEMRTPLAGMIGSLHVLENMNLEPEAKEYVRKCTLSAERFKDTINTLLSGMSGDHDPGTQEHIDPSACIEKAVELFIPAVSIQNRQISLSIDPTAPETIYVDRKGLAQSLFCLISNGLELFSESDLSVGIRAFSAEESGADSILAFYVSGTDCNCVLGHDVFVECLQLTTGKIGADLYFGSDSIYEIGFKLKVKNSWQSASDVVRPVHSLRIMLAEDDISSQVFMRKKLENWGHVVRTATNGWEVINCMADQDYDLVLMDIQMPEMNGFDAIAAIRENESPEKRIPIIVMSAYGRESDFQRMSDLGVDDYIAKPVNTEMLRKSVERLTELGRF